MTPRPTRAEMDQWRRLCDAATGGPWEVYKTPVSPHGGVGPRPRRDIDDRELPPEAIFEDQYVARVDAAFIAASRDAIPRLLDRVAELEEALRGERREHPEICGQHRSWLVKGGKHECTCGADEHNARIDEVLGE